MKKQDWNTQNKQNTKNLALWTMAWLFSMVLATFGSKFIWENEFVLTAIGVILNALLGKGMILANIPHLNGLDDLQKKIQLVRNGNCFRCGNSWGLKLFFIRYY